MRTCCRLDKLTEFSQAINYGSTGKTPYIPLTVFALLDSGKTKGFYKVLHDFFCIFLAQLQHSRARACGA